MFSFRKYLLRPSVRTRLNMRAWSSAQPYSVDDMVGNRFDVEMGDRERGQVRTGHLVGQARARRWGIGGDEGEGELIYNISEGYAWVDAGGEHASPTSPYYYSSSPFFFYHHTRPSPDLPN